MNMPGFYCHVENGGLTITVETIDTGVQYLVADWCHYGNAGPSASIPLLTVSQVDAMIKLLEDAKIKITDDHSYMLDHPEPI